MLALVALFWVTPAAAQDAGTEPEPETPVETPVASPPEPQTAIPPETETETETAPATPSPQGSPLTSALGTTTILLGVATAASVGYLLERTSALDTCATLEAGSDFERGCVNVGSLREQRDGGIGVTIGIGTAFAAVAIAWAVVAASGSGEEGSGAAVRCAPGLGTFACVGSF